MYFNLVWLKDNFGFDLAAVEAAAKKHEAIETDILAYEERVQAVVAVAQELEAENYHDIDRINARKDNVLRLWQYLLELLRARRMRLELSLQLQQNFQVSFHSSISIASIYISFMTFFIYVTRFDFFMKCTGRLNWYIFEIFFYHYKWLELIIDFQSVGNCY